MDEDAEIVDYGDDDHNNRNEDDEDAVSLGGDEDDMHVFYAYQSRSHNDAPKSVEQAKPQSNRQTQASPRSSPQAPAKLTHALPPKPIVTGSAFSLNSSQILEASAMARRTERRQSGSGKPVSAAEEPLPPDWEARNPRSGGGDPYYYNVKTHASTWTRPGSDRNGWSPERNRSPASERPGPRPIRGEPQNSSDGMSFDDRHYRPAGEVQAPPLVKDRSLPKKPAYLDPSRSPTPEFERPSRLAREDPTPARQYDSSRIRTEPSPPPARRTTVRRRESNRDRDPEPIPVDSYRSHSDRGRHREDDYTPHFPERSSTSRPRSPHPPTRDLLSENRQNADPYMPQAAGSMRKSQSRRYSDSPDSARTAREDEHYSSAGVVPQRRGRDLDGDLMNNDELGTKRRRIGDRSDNMRRVLPPPIHALPPGFVPTDNAVSPISPTIPDSIRRKRAPLPPQSMQFRDAKSTVPYAASDAPSGPAHSPRARHTADLARPEPRHQESAVGRTDHGPPSAPSGRRSRFTDPPGTMDVDMPGPPVAARPQGGMYADREEVVKDAPKGPRAMAFRGQPYVSPTTSPTTSTFPHRQPPHHMPRAPGQMAGGRLPPRPEPFRDHQSRVSPDNLRAVPDAERWSKRAQDRPPAGPQPKLSDTNSVPLTGRKVFMTPTEPQMRPPPNRNGSFSGSNSQPIGSRHGRNVHDSFDAPRSPEFTPHDQRGFGHQPTTSLNNRPPRDRTPPPARQQFSDEEQSRPPGRPRSDSYRNTSSAPTRSSRFGPPPPPDLALGLLPRKTQEEVENDFSPPRVRHYAPDFLERQPSPPPSREMWREPVDSRSYMERTGYTTSVQEWERRQREEDEEHARQEAIHPQSNRHYGVDPRLIPQHNRRPDEDVHAHRAPSSASQRDRELDDREFRREDRATNDNPSKQEYPVVYFDTGARSWLHPNPPSGNAIMPNPMTTNFKKDDRGAAGSKPTTRPRSPLIDGAGQGRPPNDRSNGSLLNRLSLEEARESQSPRDTLLIRNGDSRPMNGDGRMESGPGRDRERDRGRGQGSSKGSRSGRRRGGKVKRARKNDEV